MTSVCFDKPDGGPLRVHLQVFRTQKDAVQHILDEMFGVEVARDPRSGFVPGGEHTHTTEEDENDDRNCV